MKIIMKMKAVRIPSLLSQLFARRISSFGLYSAVLFFALSLLPTMVPRSVLVQAVGSGLAMAIGYGIGVLVVHMVNYLGFRRKATPTIRKLVVILKVLLAVLLLASLWQFVAWQNELRTIFGTDLINPLFLVPVIVLSILLFGILVGIGRLIRWLYFKSIEYIDHHLPRRVSLLLGSAIATMILILIINGVIIKGIFTAANQSFSVSNQFIDSSLDRPSSPNRSGSSDSLVSWESLGRNGRMFVTGGYNASQIAAITGIPAKEPVRAYVGLDSAGTLEERSDLLLRELIRSKAFERSSLLITTSVGDGWLDYQAVDPFELVNNGDTAIAGLQYSYLPSALSLFADADDVKLSSQKIFQDIYRYWLSLPEDSRPNIYLYGLSLGSFGVESVLNSVELLNTPIRGALLAGPPFINQFHKDIVANRDPNSPIWRPTINNGTTVRFTGRDNELGIPSGRWGNTRIAYLQHPTDPIVWYSTNLIWKRPEWLEPSQRGPGISDNFVWVPIVTAYQIGLDMILSFNYPAGYAHNYAPSTHVDAWAEITRPSNWSVDRASAIKSQFKN